MHQASGTSIGEALVVVILVGSAAAVAVPASMNLRARTLTAAGARELAVTLRSLRWKSIAEGRGHGLLFARDAAGWAWHRVRDDNGNGLRTAELADGTDSTLSGPHRLEDLLAPATLGFPPGGPFPRVPPGQGPIEDLDDPVQLGATKLLAFSPRGTSTSGTLYVTDRRRRLFAIVVFGPTSRIRVWRHDTEKGRWTR